MEFIETPEFWSTLAFLIIVLMSVRPLKRALKSWGKQQADGVRKQFDEAKNLVEQAEKLKQQYESAYVRRSSERQKLMREAETEIRFLEADALEHSSDQMRRKNQEVEMRLKMIAEHGRQDIKRKMLDRVVGKTEKMLAAQADGSDENTEYLTDRVCQALDSFEGILK